MMFYCFSGDDPAWFAAGTDLIDLLAKAVRKVPQTLRIETESGMDVTVWFNMLLDASILDWQEVESQFYLEQYNVSALES